MGKKHIQTKTLAAVAAASMAVSLCPQTVMGAKGSQIAADGTYTKSAHVVNNPEDENDWVEYDVEVALKVEDGKFSEITVTPDKNYDESESKSYFDKAVSKTRGIQTLLAGKDAAEDTVNGWDTVSSATCTSKAVKEAALEAIGAAPAKTEEPDTEPGSNPEQPVQEETYVLMNIPYAEFYRADVNNDVKVDAFSSATLNKTRTGNLAGGSYHVKSDGSEITGITFPVKVEKGVELSSYTRITDESSVDITVTNRGQTSTTTYSGKDALFESASYSYYVLGKAPSFYKEVTANEDGSLSFGRIMGEAEKLEGVSAELTTESSYGDYQMSLDGLTDTVTTDDQVYAVIISTKEGSDYGLRHLENIWRVSELAWCTGFTSQVHNCPTSSEHYAAMMGQTINKVTYYTSKGIYEIPVDDLYVPVRFENSVEVADADVALGSAGVKVEGLPADYEAEYSVEGLRMSVSDGVMTFENAQKGKYTLVISDRSGKYADLRAEFILYTEEMPAEYNASGSTPALVKAADSSEEEFADYLKNITMVSVNGESYPASGRGAVVIINEDGTVKTDAAPFAEGESFEITVSSTGYLDLSFSYVKTGDPVVEVNTSSLEKAIAQAGELREADYTADSWKALCEALENAQKALEAKESQEAVDDAANALYSAITALKKDTSKNQGGTNSGTSDGTSTGTNVVTSGSTGNSNASAGTAAKSPQTGDTSNMIGLFAAAIASLGTGGITVKRRRKGRKSVN